jgi:hypothetical protein
MFNAQQLCKKITDIYPEIGSCGVDIKVTKDHSENTWVIHLKKKSHNLNHFLEIKDAEKCMDGKQCVALGLDIAQLKKNIIGKQF